MTWILIFQTCFTFFQILELCTNGECVVEHAADDNSDERNEAPSLLKATHPGIFQSISVSLEFIDWRQHKTIAL